MAPTTDLRKLAGCLLATGAAVWGVGSCWTGSLLGVPAPYGQWTTWTWPSDPSPFLAYVVSNLGGTTMFLIAPVLLFVVALVGAWQRPLVPSFPPD
jgi:hypothetical protein